MATFAATTALPYRNDERASMGLRGQLRLQVMDSGWTESVDWSQVAVTGATESVGTLGRVWYEYTATISVGDDIMGH